MLLTPSGQVEVATGSAKPGSTPTNVPLSALLDSSTKDSVAQHFHCVVLLLDSTTALETQNKARVQHIRDCCDAQGGAA